MPAGLRDGVRGKRVAIVNDVVSAGSAVRGTFADLSGLGARVIALGALLLLGDAFNKFADEHGLHVEALSTSPQNLWTPEECPLCVQGVPLEKPVTEQELRLVRRRHWSFPGHG